MNRIQETTLNAAIGGLVIGIAFFLYFQGASIFAFDLWWVSTILFVLATIFILFSLSLLRALWIGTFEYMQEAE
ncbi:MAG: hypothetical protein ACE5IJ_08815 [Thermoplasmata archaeon]